MTAKLDCNRNYEATKAAFVDWLLREARFITNPRRLVQAVCTRFIDSGVPIKTFNAFVFTLHPDFFGVVHTWTRADNRVRTDRAPYTEQTIQMAQRSPVATIRDGVQCLRRRLDRPEWPRDFEVLNEYAAAGATDYVLLQLEFSDRSRHCVTFTTDRPGGFTTAELSLVSDLLPYMSAFTEIQNVGYLATTLLDTYIGHHAGERIMQGTIRRGTGEIIHAVIWLCDMRGFTQLSEQRPLAEVIEILNSYFDCVGIAVRKHGGEILKFIGDAMLAIFPVHGADDRDAASRAIAAAREAVSSSREANRQRAVAGQATFQIGISVHVGDVMFGNIGAPHRLDFTVIGPAVNMAARIGTLCSTLDKPVLLSEDVARSLATGAVPLGRFPLRGIEGERAVFGLEGL